MYVCNAHISSFVVNLQNQQVKHLKDSSPFLFCVTILLLLFSSLLFLACCPKKELWYLDRVKIVDLRTPEPFFVNAIDE